MNLKKTTLPILLLLVAALLFSACPGKRMDGGHAPEHSSSSHH